MAENPSTDDVDGSVLHLISGPYVTLDGLRREIPEGSKRVLVYVAIRRRRVERRQAAGALWPIGDDERAAGNLRSALWRLRGAGIDILIANKRSLTLSEQVVVDVELVNAWAQRLIAGCPSDEDLLAPASRIDALDLLPGWYDDWALLERERVRQRVLHAFEALSAHLAVAGRYAEAVDAAMTAASVEPLRESAQRALLQAHLAEGNCVESRRCYSAYRDLVRRELGVEPSAQLTELVHPSSSLAAAHNSGGRTGVRRLRVPHGSR